MTNIRTTPLYRSVAELNTYVQDRDYYLNCGYSWEMASLRAYDHLHATRKFNRGGYTS